MKRIIGLTGGIATGKTTVSNYLSQTHGLPIFDADIYSREAVQTGTPILEKISNKYGEEILLSDGNLNRQRLGKIIFNDDSEKQWIESLIHPYVRNKFTEAINNNTNNTETNIIFSIPLLFEVGLNNIVTEIWVVYCSEEQQLSRLMHRNNLTIEEAQSRINSQMPLSEKLSRADVVLDNSQTKTCLFAEVDRALKKDD